ncbi:MAG: phosphohydrolase [Piscinibacter sp.]|nr:phosphohydrolase [Piscinibacter sp.]
MHLLKLVQGQVRLGEPLPWGIRDAQGQLLLGRGHVVETEGQLAALLERGATVDIEEVRAAAARAESGARRAPSLFGLWEQVLWQLDRLLRGAATEPGFVAQLDDLIGHITTLTLRDPDIAIYLTVRQDPKRLTIYALAHAVHCAMVGLLMTRRLAWDAARSQTLLRAALTMNIAILELQGRMAAQGVPPTAAQLDQIRAHPLGGVEMLRAAGVDDEAWLETVAQHHEHPDGNGYPAGLRDVAELALVLRWIDVFMAKMAPRALRPPLTTQAAARQLFQETGGHPVAAAIIKEFGIYPPGEFVQLKSGEMAVVARRAASATTPLAAAITDRQGMPMVNTVLRDTAKPEFAITGLASNKALVLRVPPERLFGLPE